MLAIGSLVAWGCGSSDDAPSVAAATAADAAESIDAAMAVDAAPLGGTSPGSLQIQAVLLSPNGVVDLDIDDVVVTYVKPDATGDLAGFFVQAEQIGPALFVLATAASPAVAPLVGDLVSFHVTGKNELVGGDRASAIDGFTTADTGVDVEPLRQDVSATADLSSAIDRYTSELIHIDAQIAGPWEAASAGHQRAPITTAGITTTAAVGQGGAWLRLPVPTFDVSGFAVGCSVSLDGILWRFDADPQPHSYTPADVIVTCP